MSPPAGIHLEAVSKQYTNGGRIVRAVDGISLDVEPGSSLAITGPSGCGKSTLLALIGGLEAPSEGRIMIGECEISRLSERRRARLRRKELGFIFQSDNLLPFLTSVENVGLQVALHGPSGDFSYCPQLLAAVGMGELADRLPDQLSGGQRQRVAVARAVAHRPRVILADEPTGSLDAANAAALIDLLLSVQQAARATLVVVTHDPCVAARLDRTVAIRDGKIVNDTTGVGRDVGP